MQLPVYFYCLLNSVRSILDEYVACQALGMSAEAPVIVVKELEFRNFIPKPKMPIIKSGPTTNLNQSDIASLISLGWVIEPPRGTKEGAYEQYKSLTSDRKGAIFGNSVKEQIPVQHRLAESSAEINAAVLIYENINNTFVGHPLIENITTSKTDINNLPIKDKKIISVFPGSRKSEINVLLPILIDFIILMNKKKFEYNFVFHTTDEPVPGCGPQACPPDPAARYSCIGSPCPPLRRTGPCRRNR